MIPGTPAAKVAKIAKTEKQVISVEHPIGETSVSMAVSYHDDKLSIGQAAIIRTARKLFEGTVFY